MAELTEELKRKQAEEYVREAVAMIYNYDFDKQHNWEDCYKELATRLYLKVLNTRTPNSIGANTLKEVVLFEGVLDGHQQKPIPPIDCTNKCTDFIESWWCALARRPDGASSVWSTIETYLKLFNGKFVRMKMEYEQEPSLTNPQQHNEGADTHD